MFLSLPWTVSPAHAAHGRHNRWMALLLGCLVGTSAAATPFDTAVIRDPRASFIDVPARVEQQRRLSPGDGSTASCSQDPVVAPPSGPMVIPPRYAKGNHGPVHPDYEPTVRMYRDFEGTAAALANGYVATGDAAQAECLLAHLARWADAGALLDYTIHEQSGVSNQAWYQAEWSASAAALALSQVVREPSLDPARVARVIGWLHKVSRKQISYPGGVNTCCNNHAYWRGLHATMIGVLANDVDLFRWGIGRYKLAIDHIAEDGSWPLEIARHEQALHYQNYALLPVVMIAEIAAQQGLDLYAYRSNGRGLDDAIGYLARTLAAVRRDGPAAGQPKLDLRAFAPGRGDQAWAEFYRARFGRDPLGLLGTPINNPRMGGKVTFLLGQPSSAKAGS